MKSMAYLAAPHAHSDPAVRQQRLDIVARAAAWFISQGEFVFSPLSHNVPLGKLGIIVNDWQTWGEYDLNMLSRCDKLIVLKLEGWTSSQGVQAEISHAESTGLPIEYVEEAVIRAAISPKPAIAT